MGTLAYHLLPQALVLGVPEVDAQHDEIFVRVRELKAACLAANALDDALAEQLLAFLAEHFSTEERIAEAAGLDFAEHARMHSRNLAVASRAVDEVRRGAQDVFGFLRYIEYWLERHIVEEDRAFADDLHARRA